MGAFAGKKNLIDEGRILENEAVTAQRVSFSQLKPVLVTSNKKRADLFRKIPLTLSVELGSTIITVRDLLDMKEGSAIRLDKFADETVSVLVNDKHLAQGEVVVINDCFGVRITNVDLEDNS